MIETERLILRPLKEDDAEAAFVWLSDPEVNRFMPYSLYTSVEEARAWLRQAHHCLGFVRKADGLLIGSGDLTLCQEDPSMGELGYNIRRDCWNRGYTTEAARALIQDAYHTLGIRDFMANHAIANPASGRVMEHCGMVPDHYGEYSRYDGSETFPAKYYRLHLDKLGRAPVYRFAPMTEAQFGEYFRWTYPEPYTFYNSPSSAWEECLNEYAQAPENWFAALNEQGRMVGMCSFAFCDDGMELGLGLEPAQTGHGAGEQFTRACLAFGRDRYDGWQRPVTLRVADFNLRARRVYERVGFQAAGKEAALSYGAPVTFIRMVLPV